MAVERGRGGGRGQRGGRTAARGRGSAAGRGPQGGRVAAVPPSMPAPGEKGLKRPRAGGAPTVSDIMSDQLTVVANTYWAPGSQGPSKGIFRPEVVSTIYREDLRRCAPVKSSKGDESLASPRVQLLEFSCYLENYLWPHFDPNKSGVEHLMSIVLLANEKFKEGVDLWESIGVKQAPVKGAVDALAAAEGADGGVKAGGKFAQFFHCCVAWHFKEWPKNSAGPAGPKKSGPAGPGHSSARKMTLHERIVFTIFLINIFQSLEEPAVRSVVLRLCTLSLWETMNPARLALELERLPQLRRHWQHLQARKQARASGLDKYDATFLPSLVSHFLETVEEAPEEGDLAPGLLGYVERFLEFLIDLLCQLPTRRFLRVVLEDMLVAQRCSLSALARRSEGRLFNQLLEMFKFYQRFEINDQTGMPQTDADMATQHHARLHLLRRLVFKHYRHLLPDFCFESTARAGQRKFLKEQLAPLSVEDLKGMAQRMRLIPRDEEGGEEGNQEEGAEKAKSKFDNHALLLEVMLDHFSERQSQIQQMNELPLYPNEALLWDENMVPLGQYYGGKVMALPKLNLQFLTFHDYLLRSFNLFRLESAYEIRDDLVDVIKRMNPRIDYNGATVFRGWARMGVRVTNFSIVEVKKPNLGEKVPSGVVAEVEYSLAQFKGSFMDEWDQFREHDVIFLISIQASQALGEDAGYLGLQKQLEGGDAVQDKAKEAEERYKHQDEEDCNFPLRYGVVSVRGAEVTEVRDEEGTVVNDPNMKPDQRKLPRGVKRTLKVLLDPAQYHRDVRESNPCYETINLLVRRRAKENNFKGILETIRDLMNTVSVGKAVPPWLHDIFLGYGDPAAAMYRNMPDQLTKDVDFGDTILDVDHVAEAFPQAEVSFVGDDGKVLAKEQVRPPFRLTFKALDPPAGQQSKGAKRGRPTENARTEAVVLTPYTPPNPGPYPQDIPKRNTVRFTPVQMEAIRSGMNPGLTMVVGPPGTGKTDVAVQIISNLYHIFPNQRTLLVTHSNAALNDLFAKIMERDVDERHLLRLGAGEKELREDVAKDFSKWGRVNYTLARRLYLLGEVQRLADTLSVDADVGYTCETAEYFQLYEVTSRIEKFEADIAARRQQQQSPAPALVSELFPFHEFFKNAPNQPLFKKARFAEDLEVAEGCFRHLRGVFEELNDYRAFELLRSHSARADYLLTKQAKIVAMTCTHAALMRRRLVELGFKYDNLVMEESAQILEVETFIPMLLQDLDPVEGCRLKRTVLIGDHHQLPPVVKSMAFQKYSKLDQSLFTRFVRLGTPTVELNAQGRARPQLSSLYTWRYRQLGDLPNVQGANPVYTTANAGFAFEYQLIDVQDFHGQGEFTPTPYFYQNLGEAEYVVAVYQYMRLLGYPASKISILTTYNGQKHLIRDVLNKRCDANPQLSEMFGRPARVTTVDRFQGQQNDYILLSLVRTRAVGHLRDVRRLVVAMSRARLGLYVFCRKSLFENCYELTPTFTQLICRPPQLHLVLNERFPSDRPQATAPPTAPYIIRDVIHMGMMVYDMTHVALGFMAQVAEEWRRARELQEQQEAKDAQQKAQDDAARAVAEKEVEEKLQAEAERQKKLLAAQQQGLEEEDEDDEEGGGADAVDMVVAQDEEIELPQDASTAEAAVAVTADESDNEA